MSSLGMKISSQPQNSSHDTSPEFLSNFILLGHYPLGNSRHKI